MNSFKEVFTVSLAALTLLVSGYSVAKEEIRQPKQNEERSQVVPRSFSDLITPNSMRFSASCCKHCSKGKACGNSCISRSKDCHKPPGCACDS
ncbi:hypothetical protein ABFO59_13350 [Acinetobacter radioresistens]|uniref:hypothetical protein n=1 Tax=Acinetobacter radioresistens TaxID=40216 RepID=UPI000C32FEF0|nr:hypothetical protein [Acinetobacter radioresistens]PKH30934.1 hypothetical protein BJF94_08560 [Acinetobacter radioresistens]